MRGRITHPVASADDVQRDPSACSGLCRGAADPLRAVNLFHTLPELARLAVTEMERGSWLDAYLLSAGMSQILDDYLQPDPYSLRRVGAFLARLDAGATSTILAPILERAADALDGRVGAHEVRELRATLSRGLDQLAQRVAAPGTVLDSRSALDELGRALERIGDGRGVLPRRLSTDTVRLPSCFRSFDQHPTDFQQLVRRFADAHPDRRQPIVVVGVRTSGSYLAPLCAAYLRSESYAEVHALTMRPGRRPSGRDRALIRGTGTGSGLVLVCDDPPVTGGSMATVAAALERMGVPRKHIVMLAALFTDADAMPPALVPYESVVLPFSDWSIHRRLRAEVVRSTVQHLLGSGTEVVAAERLTSRAPPLGRGHVGAVYALRLTGEAAAGDETEVRLSVEGVGLGYFGQ